MSRRYSFALSGALSIVAAAAVAMAVGRAHAQTAQTQSQTQANPPATKVTPPQTKVTPPQTKVTPPQTKVTPPQTKAPTPPPAKAATPAQTKAATPAQGKTDTKTAPAPGKAAPPPAKAPAAGATPPKQVERVPGAAGDTTARPHVVIMRETFSYSAAGRRDPFLSLVLSPEFRPALVDLKVSLILWSPQGGSNATLIDNFNRKTVTARVGSVFGRMRVVAIHPNAVVFEIDDFGTTRRDSILQRPDTTR
jgi:hypothetical protein